MWRDGAVLAETRFRPSWTDSTTYVSTYRYDGHGHLASVQINDGRPRTVTFASDMAGQALHRKEDENSYNRGDVHEIWYRFAGREMGYSDSTATSRTDTSSRW